MEGRHKCMEQKFASDLRLGLEPGSVSPTSKKLRDPSVTHSGLKQAERMHKRNGTRAFHEEQRNQDNKHKERMKGKEKEHGKAEEEERGGERRNE